MINVIWKKHPASIVAAVKVLEHYDVVPEFLPLDVTTYTVETISGRLTGAASPGRIATTGLQRQPAPALCGRIARLLDGKQFPALLSNRLMALDKCPGIRLTGIGEI